MNLLQDFKDKPFIEAVQSFFKNLNVPFNVIEVLQTDPINIIGDKKCNQNIKAIYPFGIVTDAIFNQEETKITQTDLENEKYEGILLFGVDVSKTNPTRSDLAEITRQINRAFTKLPVVVVFKYGNQLTFANAERIDYEQQWREGEKVGKVSMLKDIEINNTHRGHNAILKQLIVNTGTRNKVKSFNQLYYYWQAIFSISVLNKDFYEEIIVWFNKAVKDIKIPDQPAGSEKHKDFAVRLIARLIFIWFLKELKVVKDELLLPEFDNGQKNDLIKPINKNGYYKFILQNLFFNALNSEKKERNKNIFDLYATSFDDAETIKNAIFFSPYLNGGLFDYHPNDWCEIDSKGLHKVNNAFVVPDDLFLDNQKGLNSILSRYKFTIAENTPLEEEIAVDPEMLGRIFENLLAEQSDDTKEAARKNTGAFYTPRPVVSYMCKSTLLKHLEVEIKPENSKPIIHKLLETTVLDPACGSGAFPMGMLEEMMQVLSAVDPEGKVWVAEMMKSKDEQFREHIAEMFADGQIRYVKKLGLLRSCLFGVDLLEYAIEITKLRCWLSLIVEQRVDFTKENYNLKPLPNLEFKFYKKNSLFRFYKDQNLNELIEKIDNDNLLKELVNLENQYFIAKSDRHGTKEEIKDKIVKLLEKVVDSKSELVDRELNTARNTVNHLTTNRGTETELKRAKKKVETIAKELAELAVFKNTIKDYFIESVVFPGIFNKETKNPGFDIVIGNPPYVNTKLINSMGISKKLEEEYGFCDDLYNHFTFRGLELLKSGGLLSYITSDTFLTLQTKKNMRINFLGIPTTSKSGNDLFSEEINELPECRIVEMINAPKAFAALVDTAIFTLKKEKANDKPELVYIDIRKPNANSFNITEDEWVQIRTSKENLSGWERILDRTFSALNTNAPQWISSHFCDGDTVYKDANSNLLKYKVSFEAFRKAINYAVFSPTEYNCQILEKIVKPARPVFDKWWSKIETSRQIENNRSEISKLNSQFKNSDWSIIGLSTDGGVGLQTGDNGRFVGYRSTSRFADRCIETRVQKLWQALNDEPNIKQRFKLLSDCESIDDVKVVLDNLMETEIWELFDNIKEKFGLRIFGKGYMYRIIPDNLIYDASNIVDKQKMNGLKDIRTYVPYDKGDKEGNRWYLQTPYLINWSEDAVSFLCTDERARWQGYNFFFRNGFCWTNVLNPNSSYFKCRLKDNTVNDVGSMSLYDVSGLGDKYFVLSLNSYLQFKVLREFFNNTVNIQMNDIRKLPIKIPSENELKEFNKKFDECLAIKKKYFANEIERKEMNLLLRPIEVKIDEMVNKLYGIEAKEAIDIDDLEEEILVAEDSEDDL